MNARSFSYILLYASLAMGLTACPGKSDHADHGTDTVVFVKGNPMSLVRGAQLNSHSPFTMENLNELNDFFYISSIAFSEREILSAKGERDAIIKSQSKSGQSVALDDSRRVSVVNEGEAWLLKGGEKFSITFKTTVSDDGSVEFHGLEYSGDSDPIPFEFLHWSISPDRTTLSVLIRIGEKTGATVAAFYFSKGSAPQSIRKVDKKFYYLSGRGDAVGFGQDRELEFRVCGAEEYYALELQNAINVWQKPLENRLQIAMARPKHFAPFNDLNQHCLYNFSNYLTILNPMGINPAITTYILNAAGDLILDTDIIILESEIAKETNVEARRQTVKRSMIHEMGHALGLSHIALPGMLKDDGAQDNTPSIMSYGNYHDLQPYDVEAIQALYPLKSTAP